MPVSVIARGRPVVLALACLFFSAVVSASTPVVKKSDSGICHAQDSAWYGRTTNFTAWASLRSCLDSGGRLPANYRPSAPETGYERARFGTGWSDADGDCQDSRAEALIATSTTTVTFADAGRCRVVTGRWISPFTGKVIQNASTIDIDHVVPLRWAWDRGASAWSAQQREAFANDPVNLMPVEASLNRSKGARGPDEWLPPAGQCGYVARFLRIVRLYDLHMGVAEERSIRDRIARCRES